MALSHPEVVATCANFSCWWVNTRLISVSKAWQLAVNHWRSRVKTLRCDECRCTDLAVHLCSCSAASRKSFRFCRSAIASAELLQAVAKACPSLQHVDLNDGFLFGINDEAVQAIARNCPRLRFLDVSDCSVGDPALQTLSRSCPELRHLDLSFTQMHGTGASDAGIQALAIGCPKLQFLDMSSCTRSTDVALQGGFPELRHLDTSGCYGMAAKETLEAVRRGCPKLKFLRLGTKGQGLALERLLELLRKEMPSLAISFDPWDNMSRNLEWSDAGES